MFPSHEKCLIETHLVLVEYLAVMEVGMREYPIYAATDGAQLGHRRLFDAHPDKTNNNNCLYTKQSNTSVFMFILLH